MTINYNVRKMTLKPSTEEHVEKKIKKLEKFFSDDADVTLKFVLINNQVKSEITIKDKSMVYRAEDIQTDLLDAFDNSFDNVIRRIRKQKTKLEKKLKSTNFDEFLSPVEEEKIEIIKSKKFFLTSVSPEEAVLQMDLIGHQFFIFENSDNGNINVVYKRKDGKYGLIDAEY